MDDSKRTSRAWTAEEARVLLLSHFANMARYWAETPLSRPEFQPSIEAAGGEVAYRLEGLLFSVLAAIDGGVMGLPAFNVSPAPHPEDKDYHQHTGENWWPSDVVINDCHLHELIPWVRPGTPPSSKGHTQ